MFVSFFPCCCRTLLCNLSCASRNNLLEKQWMVENEIRKYKEVSVSVNNLSFIEAFRPEQCIATAVLFKSAIHSKCSWRCFSIHFNYQYKESIATTFQVLNSEKLAFAFFNLRLLFYARNIIFLLIFWFWALFRKCKSVKVVWMLTFFISKPKNQFAARLNALFSYRNQE